MKILDTEIAGVYLIEPEPIADNRGSFARIFCEQTFREAGLRAQFSQWSISRNVAKHTLRGMHYSEGPGAETKLVQAVRGSIHDVVLDLRQGSSTYLRWANIRLEASTDRLLYIPAGVAHGFQTLVDNTDVMYHIDVPFMSDAARGVRWNDPAFGISWPEAPTRTMSERDATYPDYTHD